MKYEANVSNERTVKYTTLRSFYRICIDQCVFVKARLVQYIDIWYRSHHTRKRTDKPSWPSYGRLPLCAWHFYLDASWTQFSERYIRCVSIEYDIILLSKSHGKNGRFTVCSVRFAHQCHKCHAHRNKGTYPSIRFIDSFTRLVRLFSMINIKYQCIERAEHLQIPTDRFTFISDRNSATTFIWLFVRSVNWFISYWQSAK